MKRKYIRDWVSKEHVDMICLQETKCFVFRKESCYLLWGSNEIDWIENDASNNASVELLRCGERITSSCLVFLMQIISPSLKGFGRLRLKYMS